MSNRIRRRSVEEAQDDGPNRSTSEYSSYQRRHSFPEDDHVRGQQVVPKPRPRIPDTNNRSTADLVVHHGIEESLASMKPKGSQAVIPRSGSAPQRSIGVGEDMCYAGLSTPYHCDSALQSRDANPKEWCSTPRDTEEDENEFFDEEEIDQRPLVERKASGNKKQKKWLQYSGAYDLVETNDEIRIIWRLGSSGGRKPEREVMLHNKTLQAIGRLLVKTEVKVDTSLQTIRKSLEEVGAKLRDNRSSDKSIDEWINSINKQPYGASVKYPLAQMDKVDFYEMKSQWQNEFGILQNRLTVEIDARFSQLRSEIESIRSQLQVRGNEVQTFYEPCGDPSEDTQVSCPPHEHIQRVFRNL